MHINSYVYILIIRYVLGCDGVNRRYKLNYGYLMHNILKLIIGKKATKNKGRTKELKLQTKAREKTLRSLFVILVPMGSPKVIFTTYLKWKPCRKLVVLI